LHTEREREREREVFVVWFWSWEQQVVEGKGVSVISSKFCMSGSQRCFQKASSFLFYLGDFASFLDGANLEFRAKEFGVFDILRRKCGIEELLDSRRLD